MDYFIAMGMLQGFFSLIILLICSGIFLDKSVRVSDGERVFLRVLILALVLSPLGGITMPLAAVSGVSYALYRLSVVAFGDWATAIKNRLFVKVEV